MRNLNGKNGMLRRLGLGLLLGTALGGVAWAQGLAKFDGHYLGELTLKEVIAGDCTERSPRLVRTRGLDRTPARCYIGVRYSAHRYSIHPRM